MSTYFPDAFARFMNLRDTISEGACRPTNTHTQAVCQFCLQACVSTNRSRPDGYRCPTGVTSASVNQRCTQRRSRWRANDSKNATTYRGTEWASQGVCSLRTITSARPLTLAAHHPVNTTMAAISKRVVEIILQCRRQVRQMKSSTEIRGYTQRDEEAARRGSNETDSSQISLQLWCLSPTNHGLCYQ
jgi:hypothetical protein